MKKKLKSQLKIAFNSPEPTRKNQFLQSIDFPKASYDDFILGQIGYIRKRVWIISTLILSAILLGLHFYADEDALKAVWSIGSLLPFMALMLVTEIARSTAYHMAELEASCKHSLADIVLVRLGVLGSFNLIIFLCVILSVSGKTDFNILRLGIYLFTPFLLTCASSLFVLNRMHQRETTYICGGIAGFISLGNNFLMTQYNVILMDKYVLLWSIVFFILLISVTKEMMKFFKKMEGLQWSLSLTA